MADGILRDQQLDDHLAEHGYAVVPLLTPDEAEALRLRYRGEVPELQAEGGMAFDYMQSDRSVMRQVTELMAPFWDEHLPRVFTDHRVVFSTFVHKRPGAQSGMFLHDDRTYVDERQHRAHTIWVSLVDASPEIGNGCLYVVPGSHKIMPAASGSGTPDWVRPYEDYLERFLQPVPTRAGEAIVYDSKTLHSSPPNTTDTTREAIATAVAPRGAQLIHVVADGRRRSVYAVDPDYFVEVHPHRVEAEGMPEGYALVGEYDEACELPAPEQVAAVCDPDDVPVPQVAQAEVPAEDVAPGGAEVPPTPAGAQRRRSVVRRVAARLR